MIENGRRACVDTAVAVWCVSALLAMQPAAASTAELPRDVLTGIEAMRRLPADGFHIVESQGRLLLVSTNGHYVVSGGRILDLWNQIEVRSVADVEGTLRMPLARMGIDAKALGGAVVGESQSPQRVTVFLDPGSPESRKLLPYIRELGKSYRVEVIFVPAQPARGGIARALICDPQATLRFISDAEIPTPLAESERCGEKELERARVSVQLLGIKVLPFTVAPNGATVGGTPKHYATFVAANLE
jgi:thiol:disulfide interchange protein DsbC